MAVITMGWVVNIMGLSVMELYLNDLTKFADLTLLDIVLDFRSADDEGVFKKE